MAISEFFMQFRSLLFGSEDLLKNRRNQPRLPLELPVIISLGHNKYQGEVRDFGPNGLRLYLPIKIAKHRKLQVEVMNDSGLEGSASLGCRVAWCRAVHNGYFAGCRYDDKPEALASSWVQMLLLERHHRGKERKDRRIETTLPATLVDTAGSSLDVFVIDLSLGGARVYSSSAWALIDNPRLSFSIPGQSLSVDFVIELIESSRVEPAGYSFRLRFLDPDSKRMTLLRRMLMHLLEGARKVTRHRPQDTNTATVDKTSSPTSSSAKPLGAAVRGPARAPGNKARGVSKYLQANPPLPVSQLAKTPASSTDKPTRTESATPIYHQYHHKPGRMQRGALPQDHRERQRGWLTATLEGNFSQDELVSNFLFRPTHSFLRCLGPLFTTLPAIIAIHPWSIDTDLDSNQELGPGLLWTDRHNLCRWWITRRALIPWFVQSTTTRERLERRSGNLRSKAFQMLTLLACGGSTCIQQMLTCAQVATGIARHYGIDDPLILNNLRLAAMLKDIGEALLFFGCQPRSLRDRYTLHMNGAEHGNPDIATLAIDWSGFSCPANLQVERLRLDPITLEVMPCHPWIAYQLLTHLGFPPDICNSIQYHHEAWGGLGHPEGLGEEEIPWGARCLALADSFASNLTYLGTPERSFQQLQPLEGSFYEPTLVWALHKYLNELGML